LCRTVNYYIKILSNEWGKCNWEGKIDDVEVSDWVIPETCAEGFLKKFKFVLNKKLDIVVQTKLKEIQVNDEGIVETEEDKKEREENEKKIFYGKRVSTAGKLSMKAKEIQKIIETLGGKYAAIVNDKLDFVISNKEEVAKESSKIEQCKKLNIPIFDEEFLFDSEENNKKYEKDELEKYYLFKPTGEKKRKHEETEGDVEVVKNKKIRLTVKGEAAVDHDWYYSLLKQ
jgi:uncharacterized protein YeeX (DUF496 family)